MAITWKRTFLFLTLLAFIIIFCGLNVLPVWAAGNLEVQGYVYDLEGQLHDIGVMIHFSDGAVVSADPTYRYVIKGGGSVNVWPEKAGCRFKFHFKYPEGIDDDWVPASGVTVNLPLKEGTTVSQELLFFAYPAGYSVSGRVTTKDGKGIPGVSIYFTKGFVVSSDASEGAESITPAVTDESGHWAKDDLSGPVTIVPSKTGWNFTSPYLLVGKASEVVNFTGSEKSTISEKTTIKVNVEGTNVDFDQVPVMQKNQVMAPMKDMFEMLGIKWSQKNNVITATKGKTTIKFTIGSVDAFVNGVKVKLEQPPFMKNGILMIPVKFLEKAMGASVTWDSKDSTYYIITKENVSPVRVAQQAVDLGMVENNPAKKITYFTKAITLDPKCILAYFMRSKVYFDQKKLDEALKDINKMIDLTTKSNLAYNGRGCIYAAKNEYKLAKADFDKAIQLNPSFYMQYINRGTNFFDLGQNEEAFKDLDKAVALEPKLALPYATRGYYYAKLGQLDKAIDNYEKALSIEPGNKKYKPKLALTYATRGYYYAQLGQKDKATDDYKKAFSIEPDNQEYRQALHDLGEPGF